MNTAVSIFTRFSKNLLFGYMYIVKSITNRETNYYR